MKALVFGARGYFGQKFMQTLPGATAARGDVADPHSVARELDAHRPDVVVNCAGKTGRPNIDWCEEHRQQTLCSNVTGPLILLDECLKRDLYLVHLSSGCIFAGDNDGRGYSEEDRPNFFGSYYARTKHAADQLLSEYPVLLLRLRMPFEGTLHPRSLIGKLVHYERLIDTPNSLTYIPDFLEVACRLIERRESGLYHVVNPGTLSPLEIMQRYQQRVDPGHSVQKLPLDQLPSVTVAARSNCILATHKLDRLGIRMRPIAEAVDDAFSKLSGE